MGKMVAEGFRVDEEKRELFRRYVARQGMDVASYFRAIVDLGADCEEILEAAEGGEPREEIIAKAQRLAFSVPQRIEGLNGGYLTALRAAFRHYGFDLPIEVHYDR
jgi:hypothetical protein